MQFALELPELSVQKTLLLKVVGEVEAESALELPVELRASIYGDMLFFGPATQQVMQFVKVLNSIHSQELIDALGALGWSKMMNDLENNLRSWATSQGYGYAWRNAEKLVANSSSYVQAGAALVVFMLTGQHLFSPKMLSRALFYSDGVDEVLRLAGMKPLMVLSFPYEFEVGEYFFHPGNLPARCV